MMTDYLVEKYAFSNFGLLIKGCVFKDELERIPDRQSMEMFLSNGDTTFMPKNRLLDTLPSKEACIRARIDFLREEIPGGNRYIESNKKHIRLVLSDIKKEEKRIKKLKRELEKLEKILGKKKGKVKKNGK